MNITKEVTSEQMLEIHDRLQEKGVEILDFQVDAAGGTVTLTTDITLTEAEIKKILSDSVLVDEVLANVSDIVGEDEGGKVKEYLGSGKGLTLFCGAVAATVAGTGGAMLYGAVTDGNMTLSATVIFSILAGIYLYVVRDK